MQPIVNGLKKEFAGCVRFEKVNFHEETQWKVLIVPVGTPEFALLDSENKILARWAGFTEKEEFTTSLNALCN